MPVSRYSKNTIVRTESTDYKNVLDNRGVEHIDHYSFEKFKILKVRDIAGIQVVKHTWTSSDRFFKLANQYYNDPSYWWIIAYFNNTPLETDLEVGQSVFIPIPLEYILSAMEY
tara:strand:- start:24 stop:365 length:342 start_codon:yes stop_codon:yes gene_type:complete